MRAFSLFLLVLLASNVVLAHKKPAQSAAAAAVAASASGTVRVLVGFQLDTPIGVQSTDDSAQASAVALSRANFISQFTLISPASGESFTPGMNVTHTYNNFPFAAIDVNAAALAAIEANGLTTSVQLDEIHKTSMAQVRPLIGATTANTAGVDGDGQVVAVLDTGFDVAHPFLRDQIVAQGCFSTPNAAQGVASNCPNGAATMTTGNAASVVPNCPPTLDGCEHGTHVAGTVAGTPLATTAGTLAGVAPKAKLILVNVFQTYSAAICGGGTRCIGASTSDIVAGLDYVYSLRNTFKIAAASMSLGGGGSTTQCDATQAAYKAVIDRLKAANIATLVAAGNDGSATTISSPACISTAVSIGSTTKTDTVSVFSNGNRFLSLYAPGSNVISSVPATTVGGQAGFASLSGTSMATPGAAGVFALVRQKYGTTLTVDQVVALLKTSGRPITDTRNGVTTSRVNVAAAVAATGTTATTATSATTSTSTSASRSSTTTSRSASSTTNNTPPPTSTGSVRPGFALAYEDDEIQLFRRRQ